MGVDVRIKCSVCAWREKCTKKHTIKESAAHCPDYVRDLAFGPEDDGVAPPSEPHKKIVDPFA